MIICIIIDIVLLYLLCRTDIFKKPIKYEVSCRIFIDGEMKAVYDVEDCQCKKE